MIYWFSYWRCSCLKFVSIYVTGVNVRQTNVRAIDINGNSLFVKNAFIVISVFFSILLHYFCCQIFYSINVSVQIWKCIINLMCFQCANIRNAIKLLSINISRLWYLFFLSMRSSTLHLYLPSHYNSSSLVIFFLVFIHVYKEYWYKYFVWYWYTGYCLWLLFILTSILMK